MYTQERGPAATQFAEYSERISAEFKALIDSDPLECDVQDFMERNPCMVPGAWTPGARSGHPPIHNALITQPKLPGFKSRVPDFLWMSRHSGCAYAAMVEIERPAKKLFTAQDIPSADFTQAYNQFAQWRVWFGEPANQQLFLNEYGIQSKLCYPVGIDQHFLLIYGRRSEFQADKNKALLRGKLASGRHEELISFDRLSPDSLLDSAVTVDAIGGGRFRVKYVPETFKVSPHSAHDYLSLDGLPEAIEANGLISRERRDFLKQRVEYWCNWARSETRLVVIGGDAYEE
jgi:hypothetical protein